MGIWKTSITSVDMKGNPPVRFRSGGYDPQQTEQQMGFCVRAVAWSANAPKG